MSTRTPVDFDVYRDRYREAVEESIEFAGADLDLYTRAKARTLLEVVRRRVGDPRHLSFLDLGCGTGETDRFLEDRVASLTGVDIASELIDRARESNPWADYRSFRAGDPVPADDGRFDVAFAICVVHHVRPGGRADLLAEMRRVTRPGGLVVLFEHNPWNPLTRRAVSNCEFDRDAELLSRRTAERLLEGAGIEQVEGSYILFIPRESGLVTAIEHRLGRLPLGAQYVVSGRRAEAMLGR